MVIRRLAWTALSGKIAETGMAALLRRAIFLSRDQRLVLSHALGRSGSGLAARYATRFLTRVEGIEIHDALEAAVADLREFDRADADTASPARPPSSAWCYFSCRIAFARTPG